MHVEVAGWAGQRLVGMQSVLPSASTPVAAQLVTL
jgi:hypothetical protein